MATNKLTATILDFAAPLPPLIYWDASFIVNFSHAASPFHLACSFFAQRMKTSSTVSFVSALALDETWFTLLQIFIQRDYPSRNFWRVYESNHKVIAPYLGELQSFTQELYDDPQIRIIGTRRNSPLEALENMRQFHLLPRDAMHLAIMRQHQIPAIATLDADFQSVEGITIFTCNPNLLNASAQA